MFKYISKQIRRSAATNALFCLLLAIAGALFCIAAGLWFSAQRSLQDIDEIITTIAVPDMRAVGINAARYFDNNDITEIETPLGRLALEAGRLTLDGDDLIQSLLLEAGYDSLEEIIAAGAGAVIHHIDGSRGFLSFGPPGDRWADLWHAQFLRNIRTFAAGFAAQPEDNINNINNIVISLWLSAEENFRNNALMIIADQKIQAVREFAENHDLVEHGELLHRDERRVFGAFSEGILPLPLRMTGVGHEPAIARLSPQGFVVLQISPFRFETHNFFDTSNWFDGENIEYVREFLWITDAFIDEVIYAHPDLLLPHTLEIDNILRSDGSYMFETGNSYIVFGNLRLVERRAGQRQSYFAIDYPVIDSLLIPVDYIDDVNTLWNFINPWGATWAEWGEVRVPADLWLEVADMQPFDESEYTLMPHALWNKAMQSASVAGFGWTGTEEGDRHWYVQLHTGEEIVTTPVEYDGRTYVQIPPGWVYLKQFDEWQRAEELNRLVIDEEFLSQIEEDLPFVSDAHTIEVHIGWGDPVPIDVRDIDLPRDQFPIEIMQLAHVFDGDIDTMALGFIPLVGTLDEFMASDEWERVSEQIELNELSATGFRVLTTNDPISIFELHQQRNLIYDGRLFTSNEIRNGERVALVSRAFAEHNGLSVGDIIPLELYNILLDRAMVTYPLGLEGGDEATVAVWLPTLYTPDLELSEPQDFTIVGIYRNSVAIRALRADYVVSPDTVIIPNTAIGELYGVPTRQFEAPIYTPLIEDALIVANGRVDEIITLLNEHSDGLGDSFIFFDQGYDGLVTILNNLLFGTTWIFVLAAIAWAVVAFIFTMFYVSRKRKEAALLNALGVSRSKRTLWIFAQCAIVILFASAISIAVALPLYGDIIEVAAGVAEEFTHELRDLRFSDAEDTGLRANIPISEAPIGVIVSAAGGALLLLVIAAIVSARSAVFKTLNKVVED